MSGKQFTEMCLNLGPLLSSTEHGNGNRGLSTPCSHQSYKAGSSVETEKLGFMHDNNGESGRSRIGGQRERHVREAAPKLFFQCDVFVLFQKSHVAKLNGGIAVQSLPNLYVRTAPRVSDTPS